MPETKVLFYCEADQTCPALDWLGELQRLNGRAYNK